MKSKNEMVEKMIRAKLQEIEELAEKTNLAVNAFCNLCEDYGLEDTGYEDVFYEEISALQASETITDDVLDIWKECGLYDALVSMIEQSDKTQK